MKNQKGEASMDFLGWLCLAFVLLKLTGFITWSWWYVTMPIWIIPAFVTVVLFVLFIGSIFIEDIYFSDIWGRFKEGFARGLRKLGK